jgi:hypothetical protein
MIKVDADKEHRFVFTQKALADLLVDVLRFDGESIPDEAEVIIKEDSTYQNDYNIILSFQQSDLDTYLQEMADKEEAAEEAAEEADSWDAANATDGTEDADPDGTEDADSDDEAEKMQGFETEDADTDQKGGKKAPRSTVLGA